MSINDKNYEKLRIILNESGEGIFTVIASPRMQKKISSTIVGEKTKVFDYLELDVDDRPYSFMQINHVFLLSSDYSSFIFLNAQEALKTRDDIIKLNFSRDMLLRMHKNIVFFVTQKVYDAVIKTAHDLNSSIKLRVFFEDDGDAIENAIRELEPTIRINYDKKEDLPIRHEIDFRWPREKLLSKAITISNEAEAYLKKNRLKAAEEAFQTVLKIRLRLLGEGDIDTAYAYKNLGDVYEKAGDYDYALKYYEKALSINNSLSGNDTMSCGMLSDTEGEEAGPNSLNVATIYFGMGNVFRSMKNYERALEYFEKAAKIRESILGRNALDTMELNQEIAQIYETMGDRKNAQIYYAKAATGRMEKLRADIRIGEKTVSFGRYPQGAEGEILPIKWRVLAVKNGQSLLITEKLIDTKPYHDKYEPVTWESCALRTWMNGEFYQNFFSENERLYIAKTVLMNPGNFDIDEEKETIDKIFSLSIQEAESYFLDDEDRIARVTPYSIENGSFSGNKDISLDYEKEGWWWLRSPGSNSINAAIVENDGAIDEDGNLIENSAGSIRPALWLNL